MITFISLAFILILAAFYTYRIISSEIRPIFIKCFWSLLTIGFICSLIYTIDNSWFHGQVDMPGDEQYYYRHAESILSGGTSSFYALYDYFLGSLLYAGSPLIARMGQLILLMIVECVLFICLHLNSVNVHGFRYLYIVTAFNGIYYGTSVIFNRDILLIFFTIIFIYIDFIYLRNQKIYLIIYMAVIAYCISFLSNYLHFILLFSFFIQLIGSVFIDKRSIFARFSILIAIAIIFYLFTITSDDITSLYDINVRQNILYETREELYGERIRSWLDPVKILLGPGLIRPIFPSTYFLTYVPSHAFFYFWGTLVWYLNLIITFPRIVARRASLGDTQSLIMLIIIFLLVLSYTIVYGSGIGLRKRAMIHILYTIYASISLYSSNDMESRKLDLIKNSYHGTRRNDLNYEGLFRIITICIVLMASFISL